MKAGVKANEDDRLWGGGEVKQAFESLAREKETEMATGGSLRPGVVMSPPPDVTTACYSPSPFMSLSTTLYVLPW